MVLPTPATVYFLFWCSLFSSYANDAAQSVVGAVPAANVPAPASDGASSASMEVDPAAVGTTSSQVAASPT
jgi:hypothetical protein